MSVNSSGEKSEAEKQLSFNIKSVIALSEDYPELKADQSFIKLQGQLTEVEDGASLLSMIMAIQCLNLPRRRSLITLTS